MPNKASNGHPPYAGARRGCGTLGSIRKKKNYIYAKRLRSCKLSLAKKDNMEIEKEQILQIFGKVGIEYIPFLRKLCEEFPEVEYKFMDNEKHESLLMSDMNRGMEIYWREILYRLHLASTITIVRFDKWIQGILLGAKYGNFILYATSLRGLIESCADSDDTLRNIPLPLSEIFDKVQNSINGNTEKPVLFPDGEDKLIHFSHAAVFRRGDDVPNTWKAKTAKSYIENIDGIANGDLYSSYKQLCNLSHPAGYSVRYNFAITEDEEKNAIYNRNKKMDLVNILGFSEAYKSRIDKLIRIPMNSALICLKILNHFSIKELHTPILNKVGLDVPLWKDVEKNIKN